MKIRNGFVSNSSSSSFVISVEDESKAKAKISLIVDFKDYARYVIKNETDLDNWIKEHHGYESRQELLLNENWASDEVGSILKALEKGEIVLIGSFSDDSYDDPVETFLCKYGIPTETEGITTIRNEGGY